MPDEVTPRSLRVSPEEWAAFRALQQQLQQLTPHATVTVRDCFRTCVGSTSAVIAAGGTPVALDLPRQAPRNPTT